MAEQERRQGGAQPMPPVTTADGAVRELEKEALAAHNAPPADAGAPSSAPAGGGVVSLGKAGEGAPEEDAADISEERPVSEG